MYIFRDAVCGLLRTFSYAGVRTENSLEDIAGQMRQKSRIRIGFQSQELEDEGSDCTDETLVEVEPTLKDEEHAGVPI
jgi:hypothetical protein